MPKTRLFFIMLAFSVLFSMSSAQQAPYTIYEPVVVNVYPHDDAAFTQGLEIHEGTFYESTGNAGPLPFSTLRQVEIETGEVIRSLDVRRPDAEMQGDNPPAEYFAEGLTRAGDQLLQLTWRAGEVFRYDIETFERLETQTYEGEGWGLCYDGEALYMTDGSSYLQRRDPETFALLDRKLVHLNQAVNLNNQAVTVEVIANRRNGGLVRGNLNELECVGDYVYANIWYADVIVQIDKRDGRVVGLIDATQLLTEAEFAALPSGATLNGIAYNAESETFFITGKLWPRIFEVRLEARNN
jgi:glutaminyl-peptide cyclotransferase